MAQNLQLQFLAHCPGTSTPQLILVLLGHSAHRLVHQILAPGTPLPHPLMAQNLPQVLIMVISILHLTLAILGQSVDPILRNNAGLALLHHQMAQNL